MVLVRVMIAKVEDKGAFLEVQGWNCVQWIKEALETLDKDKKALGRRVADWQTVRNAVMAYCQRKKDGHRFDGQEQHDMSKFPTNDLPEGKEVVP
ncbi:hypothetical protein H2200_009848 [Cladophialophora chaetospira]|uniref:Uncharacterized protein n=1 Tax=Cladophialophora chaetospira TaxID=386627 RepID=A0AA38X372_9EURO|nr:hypothetical protein H2200_009848 [Cladophialophora chaetospira]